MPAATPDPNGSPKDIIQALGKMSKAAAGKWIADNYNKISSTTLAPVVNWGKSVISSAGMTTDDPQGLAALSKAVDQADAKATFDSDPNAIASAAAKQVQNAANGKQANPDLNHDGTVSATETAALNAQKAKAAGQVQANNPGITAAQATTAVDQQTGTKGIPKLTNTPKWVLDSYQSSPGFAADGNADLSQQQKSRIVDQWNEVYGTAFTWDTLIKTPQFSDPTSTTQSLVKSAVLDDQPVVTHNVQLGDGRTVAIATDSGSPGTSNGIPIGDVVKTVRYANAFGLKTPSGDVAWQPLAAILKATGDTAASSDPQYMALVTALQLAKNPPATPPNTDGPAQAAGRGKIANAVDPVTLAQRNLDAYEKAHPDIAKAANAGKSGPSGTYTGAAAPIAGVVQKYNQGLQQYGDPTMAYLASLDPGLASRLFATQGDVTKLNNTDIIAAQQLMLKGGWDVTKLAGQGYAAGSGLSDFLNNMDAKAKALKAAGIAAQGPVQTFTDPATIRDATTSLWQTLFRQDPSPALQQEMANEIRKMEASAPLADQSQGVNGVNVDVSARLKELAKKTTIYHQLYGANTSGLSEQDYQGQFVNAEQSILGGQQDNQAVLSGMESGNYNATVGAAAATGLATQNSGFLGRLAQAGQTLSQMT